MSKSRIFLSRDAIHTAYPLTTVAERAYALDVVWALEGRDEEVPCTEMRLVNHTNSERLGDALIDGVHSFRHRQDT